MSKFNVSLPCPAILRLIFWLLASTVSTIPSAVAEIDPFHQAEAAVHRFTPDREVSRMIGEYSPLAKDEELLVSFPLQPGPAQGQWTALRGIIEPNYTYQGDGEGDLSVISKGTAYLYEQFATGTLRDHRYGNPGSERAVREAIWTLEDPSRQPAEDNVFLRSAVNRFGSLENARSPYEGGRVRVISLVPDTGDSRWHGVYGKLAPVYYGKGPAPEPEIPTRVPVLLALDEEPFFAAGGFGAFPPGIQMVGASGGTTEIRESNSTHFLPNTGEMMGPVSPSLPPQNPQVPSPPVRVPESGGTLILLAGTFALVAGASLAVRRRRPSNP